jgi:1-acyl-sn-glycerol-3-phosphate acyltransferase
LIVVLGMRIPHSWLWCFALLALGSALYSPTRYSLLPAVAHEVHVPLARVNSWIEAGAWLAIVAGMVLGMRLDGAELAGWPAAVIGVVGLNAFCLLFALPVSFASDVHRPEPFRAALHGFFRDSRRILQQASTRSCLLALAGLWGLLLAATGPLVAMQLAHFPPEASAVALQYLIPLVLLLLLGAAGGSLMVGWQSHPTRTLGLVPYGAVGLFFTLMFAAILRTVPWWLGVLIGFMAGFIHVPLLATYQARLPADARGNGTALLNMAGCAGMVMFALLMAVLTQSELLSAGGQWWLLIVLAGLGAALAWTVLLRHVYDHTLEILFWPIFRIYGHGPGLEQVPHHGPLLVIANHTAWFDPVWLGKVMPRPLTGMLTSAFFDLPGLHFLATRIVHAIRVEESTFRREAPELAQAIAALDRGEAVLIFPEGQMRKRDDKPLHQFGRGVWHMLRERPGTPVVICWIEGGWGSYASYQGGPPTKNKSFDFWRRIDVAICEPEVLDPALLEDQRGTRNYLMRQCLGARCYLGLEPLPLPKADQARSASKGVL